MNILAIDVDYRNGCAFAAGVLFHDWSAPEPSKIYQTRIDHVEEYESGQFYKRELPCIIRLLGELESTPDCIVVDGHVYLDDRFKPGLGHYLHDHLAGEIAVVGVAKNAYKDMPKRSEIFRGESLKPLYVTAVGIDQDSAKLRILKMHGKYRIPTLLQKVDQICRGK